MLDRLLGDATLHPGKSLDAFMAAHARATTDASTIERALFGGLHADRLGYAFAAGYRAALSALVPELGDDVTALCASETGGAHPRAIETTLREGRLDGHKKWTTFTAESPATLGHAGRASAVLLVVARLPDASNERPRLVLARVPTARTGVRVVPMLDVAFVPEVPHAEVFFENAQIDDVLPGDGYDRYLKPFRTVEDLHVHGAVVGFLIGVARRHRLPRARVEELTTLAAALPALVAEPPLAATTHVALAGLIAATALAIDRFEPHWPEVDPNVAARFQRDRPLLLVAGKARAARREAAWDRLPR